MQGRVWCGWQGAQQCRKQNLQTLFRRFALCVGWVEHFPNEQSVGSLRRTAPAARAAPGARHRPAPTAFLVSTATSSTPSENFLLCRCFFRGSSASGGCMARRACRQARPCSHTAATCKLRRRGSGAFGPALTLAVQDVEIAGVARLGLRCCCGCRRYDGTRRRGGDRPCAAAERRLLQGSAAERRLLHGSAWQVGGLGAANKGWRDEGGALKAAQLWARWSSSRLRRHVILVCHDVGERGAIYRTRRARGAFCGGAARWDGRRGSASPQPPVL